MKRNEMLLTRIVGGKIEIRMGLNWATYVFGQPMPAEPPKDDDRPWVRMVSLEGNTPMIVYLGDRQYKVQLEP